MSMIKNSSGGWDGVKLNFTRIEGIDYHGNKGMIGVFNNVDLCTFGTQLSAAQIVSLAGDQSTIREIITIAQNGLSDRVFTDAEQACIDVFNDCAESGLLYDRVMLRVWNAGKKLAGTGELS